MAGGRARRRWPWPRRSTSGCWTRGDRERAADTALRLAVAWAHAGGHPGRGRLDEPGRAAARRPAARTGARTPALPPDLLRHGPDQQPGGRRGRGRELDDLARQHDDPTLGCFALVLEGFAAIRSGETARGFAALDEAMLPVLAGKVDALWAGDIYCTTIHMCEELADLARMRDWTEALARWSTPLSDTFMYAAVTRIHELQLVSAEGDWDVVEEELGGRARAWSARTAGSRARASTSSGRYDGCAATRTAPARRTPGRGRSTSTRSPARRCCWPRGTRRRTRWRRCGSRSRSEVRSNGPACCCPRSSCRWPTGDRTRRAESCRRELAEVADRFGTPGLQARAQQARRRWRSPTRRPDDALPLLQQAAAIYRDQRYRHAVATVHEQLARAHRLLGEHDRADAAEATALAIYRRLGARADLDRLAPRSLPGGLTAREAEVLGCAGVRREQPRGRRAPGDQREDGEPPPGQHLRQGRGVHPHRRRGLGAASTGSDRSCATMPHGPRRRWGVRPTRPRAAAPSVPAPGTRPGADPRRTP